MKIYGIKNCGSVKKAFVFFEKHSIDYEFIDLKKTPITDEKITEFTKKADINVLFNKRGTTYRKFELKNLDLSDDDKIAWMHKEQMLMKRPIIEFEDKVIIGFDEDTYEIFIK